MVTVGVGTDIDSDLLFNMASGAAFPDAVACGPGRHGPECVHLALTCTAAVDCHEEESLRACLRPAHSAA